MTNSPSTRVVLHIGAPKTGTSYLQLMLWRNRRALARQGVHVPGKRMMDHFQAGRDVLERKRPPTHPLPPWDGAFDELLAEIRRSGAHTGVISCEDFSLATPDQVERTFARLDGFAVDVVYGTRSFARQLTSQWQESVKNFNRRDLPEWLADIRRRDASEGFWMFNDVPAIVERWKPPSGRFHVVTVPGRNASDDEIWRRFLQAVGTQPRRTARVRRLNESLGYVEASLLVRVQSHLPRQAPVVRIRNVVKGFLVLQALAGRPDQVPITLPPSDRAWVDEETARRRETLRRDDVELLGDLGDLDVLPTSFGELSLEERGSDVFALTRASLAALLAFEDRQRSTLRWLEAASHMGGTATDLVDAIREVVDYRTPVVRRRHYRAAADEKLAAAAVTAADPVAVLDAGGEMLAALLLGQARRSVRIDELVGPGQPALFRRIATLIGR